jgi:hypothetical protein
MKYSVEMGSDSVICIPSLIKIGSGLQKLIQDTHKTAENKINSNYLAPQSCWSVTERAADLFLKLPHKSPNRLNKISAFLWLPITLKMTKRQLTT